MLIESKDPLAPPKIQPNYLSTDHDRKVAIDGLKMTRQIMAAEALAPFSPEEWKPGPDLSSDDELLAAAGDLGTTIFHPVGTCKMGQDAMAVVDASIMPLITSGNTHAPTMMIAEKGAGLILRDHASP